MCVTLLFKIVLTKSLIGKKPGKNTVNKQGKRVGQMKYLYVYHEKIVINKRYFISCIKPLCDIFNIDKIKFVEIKDKNEITVPKYSTYARVLLVDGDIKIPENLCLTLDGMAFPEMRIAVVSYKNVFKETPYLLAHEFGHLLNMAHCSSAKCLMGVGYVDAQLKYYWRDLAKRNKLSRRLFCEMCRSHIN